MPKYDYRCTDCGHIYEKREGFDAPALQTCPECSGSARRVLTPPAIVFKGSGWYVTDSRKGTGSESSSSSSSAGSSSDSSSTSKDSNSSSASSPSKDSGSKSESAAKT